jgi:hypothetical protein
MKTMNLAMVAMLAMGTALTTLGKPKSTYASLTPPTQYDYSYTWNATDSEQYLNVNGVDSIPLYTRTADGGHFNYTTTFNIIDGITVTQIFNRSNTAWQASGAFYKPDENRIGTSISTGLWYISINNQTNKDYSFHLDNSSSPATYIINVKWNGFTFTFGDGNLIFTSPSRINNLVIPSYTLFEVSSRTSSSANQYFDAWYLKNLGISESYQQGYDANRIGILTDYLGTDAQQIGWVLLGIAAIIFVFKGGK